MVHREAGQRLGHIVDIEEITHRLPAIAQPAPNLCTFFLVEEWSLTASSIRSEIFKDSVAWHPT